MSFAIILSDTVQTNLVSNQYQQAKRQAKKPVFMRDSEGSEIIPTRSPEANAKQISYGDLFCGIVSVLVIQELWCIIIPVVMWLSRVID